MGNTTATMEQVIEAAKNANIHDVIMQLPDGYQTVLDPVANPHSELSTAAFWKIIGILGVQTPARIKQ